MKKVLTIFGDCDILFSVMRDMNITCEEVVESNTELVSCCGCGEELRISQEEAGNWNDLDWFQCHECE